MGAALAFGSYIPGASPVHTMNAQVKIVLTCAFSLVPFFVESWAGLGLLVLLTAAAYLVAGVHLGRALAGLRPVLFILAFTVLAHALTAQLDVAPELRAGAVGSLGLTQEWRIAGNVGVTLDGLVCGCYFALRLAMLVAACSLLTFTTAPVCLTDALLSLLGPLRRVRVPVEDVVMVVVMALRFIPITTEEGLRVAHAQRARCASFDAGNVLSRARAWVPVLVPLLVRLFRRANALAGAMEARCYRGVGRTHLHHARLRVRDGVCLAVGLAVCVTMGVLL